jgi:hypothetical protein
MDIELSRDQLLADAAEIDSEDETPTWVAPPTRAGYNRLFKYWTECVYTSLDRKHANEEIVTRFVLKNQT